MSICDSSRCEEDKRETEAPEDKTREACAWTLARHEVEREKEKRRRRSAVQTRSLREFVNLFFFLGQLLMERGDDSILLLHLKLEKVGNETPRTACIYPSRHPTRHASLTRAFQQVWYS